VVDIETFQVPEGEVTFDLPPHPAQEGAAGQQPKQPSVDCRVKSSPSVKADPSTVSVSEGAIPEGAVLDLPASGLEGDVSNSGTAGSLSGESEFPSTIDHRRLE
jgi:hypothetical protein